MSDFINLSRVEAILRDGADYSGPLLSRVEQLLYELVQSIGGQSFDGPYESVEDLPNPGSTGVIYLVETGDEDNYYDEYYWDANRETYEFLGSSRIDLSNYVTKTEFDAAISAINGDISDEISARQAIGRRLDATIDILDDTVYSEVYDSYEDMVTSVTDPVENALYKVKSGNIVKEYCYEAGSTGGFIPVGGDSQDISGKADKVSGATNGNFAGLDSNGNLTDSGHKHSDYLTQHQDITGKADLIVIAPAFDDTETYYVDAMVTYNGKLYQFTSAHLPNSGWDSSKVTEIDVGTWLRTTAMRQGIDYVTAGQAANTTLGDNATAEGFNTTASGDDCHAEGGGTTASGVRSHAEGEYTIASGNYSHAEGSYTTASGSCSHAEGHGNPSSSPVKGIASGEYAHSEGNNTIASGYYAHSEGTNTIASGTGSHAEGGYTEASAYYSHAGGEGTKATKQNQTVIGKYNDAETFTTASADGEYAFQIGNGTSDNARSNALGVKWDGTLEASNDIEDGHGNVLNEMFWKGTSSEWTALPAATKAKYAGKPVYLTDDAGVYTGMPQPYRFTLTGTGSVVTRTFSHASITADMRVIDSTISNPSAVLSDMTITPANGSLTVSATVNDTTEVLLIMQPCRSAIDLT